MRALVSYLFEMRRTIAVVALVINLAGMFFIVGNTPTLWFLIVALFCLLAEEDARGKSLENRVEALEQAAGASRAKLVETEC